MIVRQSLFRKRSRKKTLIRRLIKRDTWKAACPFLTFFFLTLLCSYAEVPATRGHTAVQFIENVPFYPQEKYQCGPASLSEVLNYYGEDVLPEDIAHEIYSASAKGTLGIDMIFYAKRNNFKTLHYEGSLDDIRKNIQSGHPLIVLVDYGFWVFQKNHYMVVVGYSGEGIIVNSGKEKHKFIPYEDFLRSWKKTKFWTLLITPASKDIQ